MEQIVPLRQPRSRKEIKRWVQFIGDDLTARVTFSQEPDMYSGIWQRWSKTGRIKGYILLEAKRITYECLQDAPNRKCTAIELRSEEPPTTETSRLMTMIGESTRKYEIMHDAQKTGAPLQANARYSHH